jgi:phosphoribosylaminoimidazolecarboxamide formyltransferase/IMP cyclohydrolase
MSASVSVNETQEQRVGIRRALVSVYDKTGLEELARGLHAAGVALVSTGKSAALIRGLGIPVTEVAELTGFPECLDGRVKTLHPKVHAGILADRRLPAHVAQLEELGIEPFDLVVSNLYPFADDPGIETIDIGGPAMVRAAAKNHAWVTIVTDASQYAPLLEELDANDNTVGDDTRRRLAIEAFASTAAFDAAIVAWLQHDEALPRHIDLALERTGDALRYGENPHQHAARYRRSGTTSWWDGVQQHAGLALSYLNLYDADAAWRLVHDLGPGPAVAIIKHANPCGVAVAGSVPERQGSDLATAYQRALECDERSAFGGIVALNRPVDAATAERMVAGPQADLVIAPGWEPGAVDALVAKRKNTRLLEAGPPEPLALDFRQISGGFLVQDAHHFAAGRDEWRVVTKRVPTEAEWRDAELAWRICGHVKSNAIVLVKDGQAVGIGAGQQNRVESGEIAAKKAAGRARGGAGASDAFYPFPDGIEAAAEAGVAVIMQPGGSMRDEPNIERADELGLAMVFTGERHFLH